MSGTESGVARDIAGGSNWTSLIDEIVSDSWYNPELGRVMSVDYESIVIDVSLDGYESSLVSELGLGDNYVVVSDSSTYEALGSRIVKNLGSLGDVGSVILDSPHADLRTVEDLRSRLSDYEGVIAVGSGTINDLCKHATYMDGRSYCVFGTAASMNGYTSSTASLNLDSGLKVSLPSQVPRGFFVDLEVSSSAPPHLSASGFADCLARSVAQVDWWMSHRLLGTDYWSSPYLIQEDDERTLNSRAGLLPSGDIDAVGSLYRVLTLCGLGVSFTGVSHHGSMGEHQISHYIDCFAGDRHPGSLHGQQVGVASLTMARLQQHILSLTSPPRVSATHIDLPDMSRRMGSSIAVECEKEFRKKAFTLESADIFNARLDEIWDDLRTELSKFLIPVDEMESLLRMSGGPCTSEDLGLSVDFYREAICHNHEMRNRFSFIDIASSSGILEDFSLGEV